MQIREIPKQKIGKPFSSTINVFRTTVSSQTAVGFFVTAMLMICLVSISRPPKGGFFHTQLAPFGMKWCRGRKKCKINSKCRGGREALLDNSRPNTDHAICTALVDGICVGVAKVDGPRGPFGVEGCAGRRRPISTLQI